LAVILAWNSACGEKNVAFGGLMLNSLQEVLQISKKQDHHGLMSGKNASIGLW